MTVCAQCRQENPEIATFCLACGAPLGPPEPSAEERKLVTLLRHRRLDGDRGAARSRGRPREARARLRACSRRARAVRRDRGEVHRRRRRGELNAQDEWLDLKIRVGVNTGEALVVLGARATEGEGMASGRRDGHRGSPAVGRRVNVIGAPGVGKSRLRGADGRARPRRDGAAQPVSFLRRGRRCSRQLQRMFANRARR